MFDNCIKFMLNLMRRKRGEFGIDLVEEECILIFWMMMGLYGRFLATIIGGFDGLL